MRSAVALIGVVLALSAIGGAPAAVSIAGATAERANLWIDPSGGSCTRQASPGPLLPGRACASAGAAYGAASAGDLILVRAGTYGRQVLPGGSKRVTIRGAKGTRPVFGTTKVEATNVSLVGIKIERNDDPGPYVATLEVTGANNTFDRIDVDSKFMSSSINGRQGILNSGDRNLYKNGSTYNVIDDKGALIGGVGVTFDNFDFHDVRASHELVHNECAYSLAPNLTVRNSHFWNCATMDLFIERGTWFGQGLYCCVTIENNVFEHSTQLSPDSWHHYSLGVHGGDVQEMRNWRVINNTFETTAGADLPAPGTIWANNIGRWSCNPGATYSHNAGTKCSATDKAVSPPSSCGPPNCSSRVTAPYRWANPAEHDFRLLPGSPAINIGDPQQSPRRDNEGYARPLGSAPDAGAYETGTGVLLTASTSGRLGTAMTSFVKRNGANLLLALNSSVRGIRGLSGIDGVGVSGAYQVRRLRDAEIVLLNSNSVTNAQTRWLRETLARPAAVPRVVVLRSPPFSCTRSAGSEAVRRAWVPLFNRYGVRLVVSGGTGSYERFSRGGPTYVVAGNSSIAQGGSCPRSYPRRRAARAERTFVYLTVDASGVQARAISEHGNTVDRFRTG